jgi:hypothetical protein
MAWDKFRMNSLIERWRDERRANRLRGLAPVYGNDGKLKVQIVFPSEGDEVLGAKEEMMQEVNALEVILRSTFAAPPKGLLDSFMNHTDNYGSKSQGESNGESADFIDGLVGHELIIFVVVNMRYSIYIDETCIFEVYFHQQQLVELFYLFLLYGIV